jgi:hypothetical protein
MRYWHPWNASWGSWRTFFKPDISFWMTFTFQGRSSLSWRWQTFWATHRQKDRKCWKNSRTHVCSLTLDKWQKACVLSYERRLTRTQFLSLLIRSQRVTKVGFMVMVQEQSNSRRSRRAHNHQEKKGTAGPEFNKGHAHYFFNMKGLVHCEFVPPNTMVNSDFNVTF